MASGWVILSLGSLENGKDTFKGLDKQELYIVTLLGAPYVCHPLSG